MFRRRRPLLRAAAVGGTAYVAGRHMANKQAEQQYTDEDQEARLSALEQQQASGYGQQPPGYGQPPPPGYWSPSHGAPGQPPPPGYWPPATAPVPPPTPAPEQPRTEGAGESESASASEATGTDPAPS